MLISVKHRHSVHGTWHGCGKIREVLQELSCRVSAPPITGIVSPLACGECCITRATTPAKQGRPDDSEAAGPRSWLCRHDGADDRILVPAHTSQSSALHVSQARQARRSLAGNARTAACAAQWWLRGTLYFEEWRTLPALLAKSAPELGLPVPQVVQLHGSQTLRSGPARSSDTGADQLGGRHRGQTDRQTLAAL